MRPGSTPERNSLRGCVAAWRAPSHPDLRTVRDALLIDGLDVLRPAAYLCMAEAEADAKRRRYLELG